MEAFTRIEAIAAPLRIANIDTDMLVPARFLKTVSRYGLARSLFHAQRFAVDGSERLDFILNREPWRHAGVLVVLDNFGCGSSREHAPWALLDFGIRCVIAPSFAEIFHSNCFKNGILPVTLPADEVDHLMTEIADPARARLIVDLERERIDTSSGRKISFLVDRQRRERLLGGLDDISTSLAYEAAIADHERRTAREAGWIGAIPTLSV
jgi:3-isopropylmalate/(R)-2-methylmalate dehydratase small subunit